MAVLFSELLLGYVVVFAAALRPLLRHRGAVCGALGCGARALLASCGGARFLRGLRGVRASSSSSRRLFVFFFVIAVRFAVHWGAGRARCLRPAVALGSCGAFVAFARFVIRAAAFPSFRLLFSSGSFSCDLQFSAPGAGWGVGWSVSECVCVCVG